MSFTVDTTDARLSDQRTPSDGSVTYLKLISRLKSWLTANGYANDTDMLSPHNWLPNNWAVLDANNNYNQMVELPRKNWDATNSFASANMHPTFTVNSTQSRIFIGKGQAVDDGFGHPVSWMNHMPMVGKTFDQELAACTQLNNGTTITGFHEMTNAEWALISQISKQQLGSTPVYGNNNFGQDIDARDVTFRLGTPAAFNDHVSDGKSFAGSGGHRTSHNYQPDGIFDLNGNVWERVGSMKIVNGEIQILADNDGADYTKDQSASSTIYKAILDDGTLVAPGTIGTLKYSLNCNITKVTPAAGTPSKAFESIGCEADVSTSCAGVALLKTLGLYPYTTGLNSDWFWLSTVGEFVPIRGGRWSDGPYAGLFALYLGNTRASAGTYFGFRLAFKL